MLSRTKTYNGMNILKKEHFDYVYNNLKTQNFYLLCSNKKIITNENFYYANTIKADNNYLYWQNYGSSAVKRTKKDFKWLLQNIFDNCNYFMLINKKDYFIIVDAYLENVFNERQKQLTAMEG